MRSGTSATAWARATVFVGGPGQAHGVLDKPERLLGLAIQRGDEPSAWRRAASKRPSRTAPCPASHSNLTGVGPRARPLSRRARSSQRCASPQRPCAHQEGTTRPTRAVTVRSRLGHRRLKGGGEVLLLRLQPVDPLPLAPARLLGHAVEELDAPAAVASLQLRRLAGLG